MNGLGEIFRLSVKSYRDALALVSRAGPTLFTALVVLAVGDIAGILAMRMFATELGKTLIMVTHDPRTAAFADRVLHLEKGRLVDDPAQAAIHVA